MSGVDTSPLAKITWQDPQTGDARELVLSEGASASIGRLDTNEICIKEQHVSRQHAIIDYQDGMFVITDNDSANGVFINDQRLTGPYPLVAGDVIRLYVPTLSFAAMLTEEEQRHATQAGMAVNLPGSAPGGRLVVTSGPEQGNTILLTLNSMTIGRATGSADWEICVKDPSISRPHARLERIDGNWVLYDLGSANGTAVNGTPVVNEAGRVLHDGDVITLGGTVAMFHST
ncbi:MAG: FHA domain-containing protein [Anaerolineae bacterium]|nr:FHA domain-containing protein [Anaerolineae bacterium]